MINQNEKGTGLSESFIERVRNFKHILKEVETSTIGQTLSNFEKDRNPESELELWECMASAYQDFSEANPEFTLEQKKDVLRVLLQLSWGAESLETEKTLNDRQIKVLRGYYIYRDGKKKPVSLSYIPEKVKETIFNGG